MQGVAQNIEPAIAMTTRFALVVTLTSAGGHDASLPSTPIILSYCHPGTIHELFIELSPSVNFFLPMEGELGEVQTVEQVASRFV